MKPSAARRVERAIRELIKHDGDRCSICHAPLQHNSRTFGGTTKSGDPVLAGECCQMKVTKTILGGLYLDSAVDDLVFITPTSDARSHNKSDIERAVTGMQSIFGDRQAEVADIVRRAGVPARRTKVSRGTTAWGSDDAEWFAQHPTRSHRLRPPIGDELNRTGFDPATPMPPRHQMQIIIRQIEPGKRMRLTFGRNLAVPIPDDETVLHSLFDIVSNKGDPDGAITMNDMRAAIRKNEKPGGLRPS